MTAASLPEGHASGGVDALNAAQGVQRPQVWSHVPGGIRHLPCSQQLEAVNCAAHENAVILRLVGMLRIS